MGASDSRHGSVPDSVFQSRRIGTIGDAADRYDTDVAHIWELISLERSIVAPDGVRVKLIAPPDERENGTLWIVSEVPA